jgi:hypothetical protein
MRNTLLKKTLPMGALATVVAALVWALMPASEQPTEQAPSAQPQPLPAATSPASSQSAPTAEPALQGTPFPLNAEQLTERAKQQLALNPSAALEDIAKADQLAGTSADAQNETRRVLEIHALVRLGKVGLARTLTDRFYRTFPNSDRAVELERLTGYHPRPASP